MPAARSFLICFHWQPSPIKDNDRLNTTLLQHLHFLHAVQDMPAHQESVSGSTCSTGALLKKTYLSVYLPSQISSAQQYAALCSQQYASTATF